MNNEIGFQKWTEIERLYQVRRMIMEDAEHHGWQSVSIDFRPKVKLHGTNAGIRIESEAIGYQGRNRMVGIRGGPEYEKFYDFQDWADSFVPEPVRNSSYTVATENGSESIASIIAAGGSVTIYGEWCGPRIQKQVASSKTKHKFFAVFALRVNLPNNGSVVDTIVDPEVIAEIVGLASQPVDTFKVLPWQDEIWTVNMLNEVEYEQFHSEADESVASIEKCDPFMQSEFGIDGLGEGLVFYPLSMTTVKKDGDQEIIAPLDHTKITRFLFKVKGEKHQKKSREKEPVDQEKEKRIKEFIDRVINDDLFEPFWDESKFQNPQDIPEWCRTAGPAVKTAVMQALESDAGGSSELEWNDLKGIVGKQTVKFMQTKLGF